MRSRSSRNCCLNGTWILVTPRHNNLTKPIAEPQSEFEIPVQRTERPAALAGLRYLSAGCAQNGVEIIKGVLSADHVHMFVPVLPKLVISDLMLLIKGRSSCKI